MIKNKRGHTDFGTRLKSLVESDEKFPPTERPDTKTEVGKKDFIMEILNSWREARTYDDKHLYTDHIGWLKTSFGEGWFNFPDDYDFDTSSWSLGMLIAQVERYGGVVIDTDKGTLPVTHFPTNVPDNKKRETINEKPKL
jgi:hypothetical protein